MEVSVWACCGVLVTFVAYYPLSLFFTRAYPKSVAILRRYISTPSIPRRLPVGSIRGKKLSVNIRRTDIVTPLYIIFATVVLILNIIVLALSAKSRNLLIWRSGRVLAFNLCILIVSGRQSIFSDNLGIAYEFQAFLHRWLGRIVFLIGIIHVVITLVSYQPGGVILSVRSRIAGFTAALALFALILSSFFPVRQKFYEIFRCCHVFFAVIILVGGFLHLTPIGVSKPSSILFIITAIMYCLLFSIRTGILILQRANATVFQGDGLLKIDLELTRPVRVRAGQHIWLRIPSASHTSFAESHPFTIASWEEMDKGKAKKVTLLVDVRAGFTRKLRMLTDSKATNSRLFNAYIEGPYGLPLKAEEYGTVILYATGIGIGAQLATVKHLLDCREAGTAKTQRVTLLWEVDQVFVGYDEVRKQHFVEEDTAQQMVKHLLQQDCDRLSRLRIEPDKIFEYKSGWQGAPPEQGYMFRCTRYVRNKPRLVRLALDENNEENHSSTDTLRTRYHGLDPKTSLESQLQDYNCRGRVLVSVCAHPTFADSIRSIVAPKALHLHEHEFRPERRWPIIEEKQETAEHKNIADDEKTIGYM